MRKPTFALALSLTLALSQLPLVSAQVSSTVMCFSNSTFLYNSRQQSPCLVRAYLGSVCSGGRFTVSPLEDGEYYTGPREPNDCSCSTVTYSLVSACGVCQAAMRVATWSSWSRNCTRVYVQHFPSPIPSQVTVPNWAYADVTIGNSFDPNVALNDNGPESSAPGSTTTGTVTGTSTSTTTTDTTSTSSVSGGSSTNVGAIAGGVVGGVVGLAVIGLGVFLCLRRKQKEKQQQIAAMTNSTGMQENVAGGLGFNPGYGTGATASASGLNPNSIGGIGTQYAVQQQWTPTGNSTGTGTGTSTGMPSQGMYTYQPEI